MKDFKPSPLNHGKGSVAGQLVPVEHNRLTMSETVSIDEPAGGYMEMLKYRNSARGYVMALEDKGAMEGYLERMLRSTTLKQKAYGTLASSEMQAETIEQLVSLPWKAVVLKYFEEEMRTTPRIHALMAVPYVRTELQLRFAWCMMGLTRGENDSEERKRSKGEKVFLMTNLRDLIMQEGMAVACAKRRDALCFIRFLIEQISVPALKTCVKMLREGDERAKALLLLALLKMHQSKPMRVNMKEPEELEPMRKIDKIRRFSNKELILTKESMGPLPKSSEYCGPIKKKSYSYLSGIIGIAYNPVTTAVKRISRTSERCGKEKEEMLKEDSERNVTLCLHNSFCPNRESNVDPLPCCKQRVEEQKCWRIASNSVRIANDVLQDTETESAVSVSQEEEMER